ncbi:MAG: zinc-ribbon domain-containing protein [Clostridia bacterium]|nr:zinc-ribbon domain-containing protein [Clostridia bacterium]
MGAEKNKTAAYKIIEKDGGRCYRFFCEASGMAMVTTKVYRCDNPEEELQTAWAEEGREHFNLCHKCGKWVCDAMYNADVLHCADCTPWENKPKYCSNCGTKVGITDTFCRRCGAKLQYREVKDDG